MRGVGHRAVLLTVAVVAALGVLPALGAEPAGAAPPAPVPCSGGPCWRPPARTSWQIQLQGKLKTSVAATLYDVDLFDTPTANVASLHAAGRKVACYFSA